MKNYSPQKAVDSHSVKIHGWLLPLSWIYHLVVSIRNYLFDSGILKQQAFNVPIISVGNITVGGTGKTPHVEYLIRLLHKQLKVAVLSRGYKRKSKGYLLADESSTICDIGDEPLQMFHKFNDIYVAVDRKRVNGIQQLVHNPETKDLDVILLDDAYQHRYVKPGINILLINYHRLISNDALLPAGRLREPASEKKRADIVIITKCPPKLKPMDFRVLTKHLQLMAYQELYFTTLTYGELQPLFIADLPTKQLKEIGKNSHLLLLTGIATPKVLENDLQPYCHNIHPLFYPDHHFFTEEDAQQINQAFAEMPSPKLIVTTEKDATRLHLLNSLSDEVRQHIYTLPVTVKFMLDQEEQFNKKILSYLEKNSRNSILVKGKEDYKEKPAAPQQDKKPNTISFINN